MCKKDYIWNPSAWANENGKYSRSIISELVNYM